MEQIVSQESTGMGFQQTKKKNTGMIAGMAVLAILAVGGVGFGVYGMAQKSSDRPAEMKVEVKNEDGTTTTLETEKVEVSDDNKTVTITDTATVSGGPYIKDGYFYVPEWDLKFKIPDDLANYGYAVNYDSSQSPYTLPTIGFTAMLKSDVHGAQARYYDDIETCAIVSVSKESGAWDDKHQINGIIKQFDNYALLIWNYHRHQSCDYKLHIDEVQAKIHAMFQNPETI